MDYNISKREYRIVRVLARVSSVLEARKNTTFKNLTNYCYILQYFTWTKRSYVTDQNGSCSQALLKQVDVIKGGLIAYEDFLHSFQKSDAEVNGNVRQD